MFVKELLAWHNGTEKILDGVRGGVGVTDVGILFVPNAEMPH